MMQLQLERSMPHSSYAHAHDKNGMIIPPSNLSKSKY